MSSEKPVTPTIPIIITTPLVDRELSVIEEMTSLSDNDTQRVCITRLRYRGNDKSLRQ
jgi:hypothetical protein